MFNDTYGHTSYHKAFDQSDVYGIGYDADRASRKPLRLGLIGAGGVAQSKYFPAVARLRMIWEPIEIAAFAEPREDQGAGGGWRSAVSETAAVMVLARRLRPSHPGGRDGRHVRISVRYPSCAVAANILC